MAVDRLLLAEATVEGIRIGDQRRLVGQEGAHLLVERDRIERCRANTIDRIAAVTPLLTPKPVMYTE